MKLSVAMATHNGATYLGEQLDSIFAQIRLPDEMVVCDDQSSDATLDLLREYARRAPFPMRIVTNPKRLGSTKNFEQAVRLCSGDIVALSDQDDVWRPHKLAVVERQFQADPELGLLFTNGDLIDGHGAQLRGDLWSRFFFGRTLQKSLECPQTAYNLLLSRYFITGATMAFRSQFLDLCLPVPRATPTFIHDRWIAVVIGAFASVGGLDEKLISYRLHPQQQMGVGKRPFLSRHLTPYACSSDAAALALMRARLVDTDLGKAKPGALAALEARQRHLAARSALSRSPIRRARGVAGEYLSGGYGRYPLGLADAVKDLLVGTR
jgi:hypothetical protein